MSILGKAALLSALPLLGLAACDKTSWESVPMVVSSDKGPVTCQLYGRDQVLWDTSIAHPAGMSKEDADAICQKEGQRVKDDKSIVAKEM